MGEITFSLELHDYYEASAESNNPDNYMSYTHFSELRYWDGSMQSWTDIGWHADSPYYITLISSHEFCAGGGYYGLMHTHRGSGYIVLCLEILGY